MNDAHTPRANLWCADCRRYGDHMTAQHPEPPTIPDCQGVYARFDVQPEAERLMDCMVEEFGGTWRVMRHGEHFHVVEAVDA